MADENIALADLIENFKDDMYCWILDPNSSPQTKRFLFPKIIQEQRMTYAVNVGSANAIEVVLKSPLTSYEEGVLLYFKSNTVNTGALTLKVDALAIKSVVDREGNPLAAGAIPAGSLNVVQYDGTNFQLLVSAGGGVSTDPLFDVNNVVLSGSNITLDINSLRQRIFDTTVAHSANFNILKTNNTNGVLISYTFEISAPIVITLQSNDLMGDNQAGWNDGLKQLTISIAGVYEITWRKRGANFLLTLSDSY